jgi:hypothetical protein
VRLSYPHRPLQPSPAPLQSSTPYHPPPALTTSPHHPPPAPPSTTRPLTSSCVRSETAQRLCIIASKASSLRLCEISKIFNISKTHSDSPVSACMRGRGLRRRCWATRQSRHRCCCGGACCESVSQLRYVRAVTQRTMGTLSPLERSMMAVSCLSAARMEQDRAG